MGFPFGNNNGYGGYNGYGSYGGYGATQYGGGYQPPQPPQPSQVIPPKTNKIFVTSLEEAMARPAEPNTEIIYLHQNEPLLFEVTTDLQGRKSVKTFHLSEGNVPKQEYVPREEFEAFKTKFDALFLKEEKVDE